MKGSRAREEQKLEPATLEERAAGWVWERLQGWGGPGRDHQGRVGWGGARGGARGRDSVGSLEVREDAADHSRVGDDGDEVAAAFAAWAREDVDGEHAAQQLSPGEARAGRRCRRIRMAPLTGGCSAGRWARNDVVAQGRGRGQHAVVGELVLARMGNQGEEGVR